MELEECLQARHSVRGYDPERLVEQNELEDILSVAQCAPSNCNVQPWRVFVAWGKRCDQWRQAMTAAFDGGDTGSPEDPVDCFFGEYRRLQVECAVELYGAMGIERRDKVGRMAAMRRNFELFDAPHALMICVDKRFGMSVVMDVGMYVQTLMLLFKNRGIDSCSQASVCVYPQIARDILDIPDDLRLLCGMSFGYQDNAVPANQSRQARQPWDKNVTWKCD